EEFTVLRNGEAIAVLDQDKESEIQPTRGTRGTFRASIVGFTLLSTRYQSLLMNLALHGADIRVQRADDHLKELKRLEAGLPKPNVIEERDFLGGAVTIERITKDEIPPMTSILIGEVVYNLRAALDYLVYELAILDSGSIQDGTQFP